LTKWITEVEELGLNAIAAKGMDIALKDYIVNTVGIDNADQVLYDTKGRFINQTFDYGTVIFGKPDQRALLPFGVDSSQASGAIDAIRKDYPIKELDKDDVILENVYNPEAKNLMVIVKLRENPTVKLGTVTYQNGAILTKKYEDME
jgi:hypothetical protein